MYLLPTQTHTIKLKLVRSHSHIRPKTTIQCGPEVERMYQSWNQDPSTYTHTKTNQPRKNFLNKSCKPRSTRLFLRSGMGSNSGSSACWKESLLELLILITGVFNYLLSKEAGGMDEVVRGNWPQGANVYSNLFGNPLGQILLNRAVHFAHFK